MCGISGFFDTRDKYDSVEGSLINAMNDKQLHRGPDACETYVRGRVGLGHTRLSIIDVSDSANQPMMSKDNRLAIVFNGEIYNYKELKSELVDEGITFETCSDTEVLLYAYAMWGRSCLHKLNGMFAFAVYDFNKEEMFLARDRFGIKTLHYAFLDGVLYFSSEIKALVTVIDKRDVSFDRSKLLEFLMYRECIKDTFFEKIKTLEPGSFSIAKVGEKNISETQWFSVLDLPDYTLTRSLRSTSYESRVSMIETLLTKSVELRLVSDVPLGTLCSGGLDSSLITAIACRINPNVSVYHVDVEGASERVWAEKVARHLNIDIRYVVLNEQSFLDKYVEAIYHNDFPLTHPNGIGVYYVSDCARNNSCKVLLTGEGADETFGGYDWRYRDKLRYLRLQRFLYPFKKLHSKLVNTVSGIWLKYFNEDFNFKSRAYVNSVVNWCSDGSYRQELLKGCRRAYSFDKNKLNREIKATMLSDLRDYLIGILHRQDRSSMQASIESRVPFLDHELVKAVSNLPLSDKIKGMNEKAILKDIALRYLPRDVVYRRKVGFGTPSKQFIRKINTGIFHNGFLKEYCGLSKEKTVSMIDFWPEDYCNMFYGLEIWGRLFIYKQSIDDIKNRFIPIK